MMYYCLKILKTAMRRPTNKELDILDVLVAHPRGLYGLEIVEKSNGKVKRGSVYVYMNRLHQDNLVEVQKSPPPKGQGGLPRPIYRITGLGQRILDAEKAYDLRLAGVRP